LKQKVLRKHHIDIEVMTSTVKELHTDRKAALSKTCGHCGGAHRQKPLTFGEYVRLGLIREDAAGVFFNEEKTFHEDEVVTKTWCYTCIYTFNNEPVGENDALDIIEKNEELQLDWEDDGYCIWTVFVPDDAHDVTGDAICWGGDLSKEEQKEQKFCFRKLSDGTFWACLFLKETVDEYSTQDEMLYTIVNSPQMVFYPPVCKDIEAVCFARSVVLTFELHEKWLADVTAIIEETYEESDSDEE